MPNAPRSFVAKLAGVFACVLILATVNGASAQAPNNPAGFWWTVNWSFDNSAPMAPVGTQQICFLANGTWWSPFPGWHGRWFQKGNIAAGNGDHVSVNGNYAANVGNDTFQLDFVHVNMMTGPWAEWRDNFVFVAWVRAVLTRAGQCGPEPVLSPTAARAAASTKANPMGEPARD